ncbi:MAG: transaldolase [Candidatus Omnitrophota bacterium]|nr:transaldolase [Candidatus Omnitrophota bacterium]
MSKGQKLRIKLCADGADLTTMAQLAKNPLIKGFTTNPTLMHKAHVRDYRSFARDVLGVVGDRPVSFEVFSDDFSEMERQAEEIASWGEQVYVKIPVTNTRGEFSGPLIRKLSAARVKLNVTAVMTPRQVADITACFADGLSSYISIFAGRIADTGRDPVPLIAEALAVMRARPQTELIWASPRELLNLFQAEAVGCHIITATSEVLAKLPLVGKDLTAFSLETVQMFRQDAVKAGLHLELSEPSPVS